MCLQDENDCGRHERPKAEKGRGAGKTSVVASVLVYLSVTVLLHPRLTS